MQDIIKELYDGGQTKLQLSIINLSKWPTDFAFRASSDARAVKIQNDQGFVYPSAEKQYAAGKGGIYFAQTVSDVLKFSKDCNDTKHFFVVGVPEGTVNVEMTYDNRLDIIKAVTNRDTWFENVAYGADRRTEFVKSGPENSIWKPDCLIKVNILP